MPFFIIDNNFDNQMKRIKQTEDMEATVGQSSSLADNYQSFAVGSTKRFVNLAMPQIQLKSKQHYKKQPYCVICFRNFTTTFRQHHCRICANAVCGDCSRSMINKERACDLCILKLSNPQEQKKKKQMLDTLETLCAYLLYRKKMKMQELEEIKFAQNPDKQTIQEELSKQKNLIEELEKENEVLKQQKQAAEKQMDQLRSKNAKIQENISKIENSLSGFNF